MIEAPAAETGHLKVTVADDEEWKNGCESPKAESSLEPQEKLDDKEILE